MSLYIFLVDMLCVVVELDLRNELSLSKKIEGSVNNGIIRHAKSCEVN